MSEDPRLDQGDSAGVTDVLPLLVAALPIAARRITESVEVGTNNGVVRVVRRTDGMLIESLEALQTTFGIKPKWRRPVIAGRVLSEREDLVRRRVAQGRTTREVARELGVSDRTVTTLRRSLREFHPTVESTEGPRGVAVLGPPGLARDLVHACLEANRSDVHGPGVPTVNDVVRVFVNPTERMLSIAGFARLVIVGPLPEQLSLRDAVRLGAVAQLSIHTSEAALVAAVQTAERGESAFSSASVDQLVDEIYVGDRTTALTQREINVIEGIRLGESVKQTARRLGVSPKTIDNRRHQMFKKFGVRSAAELDRAVGSLRSTG